MDIILATPGEISGPPPPTLQFAASRHASTCPPPCAKIDSRVTPDNGPYYTPNGYTATPRLKERMNLPCALSLNSAILRHSCSALQPTCSCESATHFRKLYKCVVPCVGEVMMNEPTGTHSTLAGTPGHRQ